MTSPAPTIKPAAADAPGYRPGEFGCAFRFTLREEVGNDPANPEGYVNDPHDPGGETKWGISKRAYPELDISGLSFERARGIYHDDFWLAVRCHQLPPPLDLLVFDAAVNCGVKRAVRWLQQSLGVEGDGALGPRTADAARTCEVRAIGADILRRRLAYYTLLLGWPRYGAGWTARVHRLATLVGVADPTTIAGGKP